MMKRAVPSSRTATNPGEKKVELEICDIYFVGSSASTAAETRYMKSTV